MKTIKNKTISFLMILALIIGENSFSSFSVSISQNINRYQNIQHKKNYYQMLENTEEEQKSDKVEITKEEKNEEKKVNENTLTEEISNSNVENNKENKNEVEPKDNILEKENDDEEENTNDDNKEKIEEENTSLENEIKNENQEKDLDKKEEEQTENDLEKENTDTENNDTTNSSEENNEENQTDKNNEKETNNDNKENILTNETNNTDSINNAYNNISSESEIENAGLTINDIEALTDISTESETELENEVEKETATKSETEQTEELIENKIATDSEIITENISTNSEVEMIISTESETKVSTISSLEDYILLDSLSMINYFGGNATKENDVITLNNDIKINYPIIINETLTLDLNGYDITKEEAGFALIVTNKKYHIENNDIVIEENIEDNYEENNKQVIFSLIDNNVESIVDINAMIMKNELDKDTIYVDNATFNIKNIKIHAAETKNAIYLKNSNFTMENSYVFGGSGNAISENGGAGIYADFDSENYNLNLVSGSIRGGDGTASNNDNKKKSSSALTNGLIDIDIYEHTITGKPCDQGCGVGGNAIYVNNENYDLEKVVFGENMVITSGDGGKKITLRTRLFSSQDIDIFGDGVVDTFGNTNLTRFSLVKPGDETNGGNGSNLSQVSSLKDQGSTNLCNVFSYTAAAETYLMKHYRQYVNTMIDENSSELDFSEESHAFQLYNFISDPLGNAPDAHLVSMNGKTYKSAGTNPEEMDVSFTNLRGVVPESVAPWKGPSTLYQSGEIDLSRSNNVAHLYEDYATYYKDYDNVQSFVNDMKNKIYDGGVIMATFLYYIVSINPLRTASAYGRTSLPNNDIDATAKQYYEDNYSFLPNSKALYFHHNPDNQGGHTVFIVGWDDEFPKECFPASYRPTQDGAFLIKNSWGEYDWLSYYAPLERTTQFHHTKWFPANTQFENLYYYDNSLNVVSGTEVEKATINYQTTNDKEKLQAVSMILKVDDTNEYQGEVKVYKKNNITKVYTNDNGVLVGSKNITFHSGLNYFDISDLNIVFDQGQCFAVEVCFNDQINPRLRMDREESKIVASYSISYEERQQRYFHKREGVAEWKILSDYMPRFKVYTNNLYNLTIDANGGQFVNGNNTISKNIYLTDNINIDAFEEPQKQNSYFGGWYIVNADGSKKTMSGNLVIDKPANMTIYASWSEVETFKALFNVDGTTGIKPTIENISNIPEQQNVVLNNKIIKPIASPSASGFEFLGWYKEPNCENLWDFDTTISNETTLYAKWRAINYNIKFDLNGLEATTPSEITKTYQDNITLPKPTNVKLGYIFVGWYKEKNLTNEYTGNEDLTGIENDTRVLYAKWQEGYIKHTIYFLPNGGSGVMEPQVVNEGVETILNKNTFTRTGYNFTRWSLGNGTYYNDLGKISNVTSDLYLSATWNRNTGGGGNGGGGGGGGGGTAQVQNNAKAANSKEAIKETATKEIQQDVAEVAKEMGIQLDLIKEVPIVKQFMTVEKAALEYRNTIDSILDQYKQSMALGDNKSNVFNPANQTALTAKAAEEKLTKYEVVQNQTTGKFQLKDTNKNKIIANCWQEVEKEDKTTGWYKCDKDGNLETGIVVDGNRIFLLDEVNQNGYGQMVTGNYNIGMLSLVFAEDGSLKSMQYNEVLYKQMLDMVVLAAVSGQAQ